MRSEIEFSPGATNTGGERWKCLDGFESLSISNTITDDTREQEICSLILNLKARLSFLRRSWKEKCDCNSFYEGRAEACQSVQVF